MLDRRSLVLALALVTVGCSSTHHDAVVSCTTHLDETSCGAEPACAWYGFGTPCPVDQPSCRRGVCEWPAATVTGDGTADAQCACPDGEVCFEQAGGPPQPADRPALQCIEPADGVGDPCARIEGQGTCKTSTTIRDLCLCDNGIR